ncbi:sensor histidine kinase [Spirosoma sp. KUDC1026]|uniref:sensor histidine kinase n=1 Tax=Spirosoma sp. KUDC1026 TaxID=2745947 RepID=UPI00159BBA79|nr:histidine kinase [Spirosoma sp. KUDC1026]QKZ12824.1 histidine kinase [Spirosoma sp. KUDC1026]
MQEHSLKRYAEPLFLIGLATIYVIRRLLIEVNNLDGMIGLSASGNGIPAGTYWPELGNYDHTLNNNIPLIAGVCLFLGAWSVFRYLAYPRLSEDVSNRTGWLYVGLTVALLLVSTFVYHYLKLYVRYKHLDSGDIFGLRVYSLYRKRTVLADAIGLGILLATYEIIRGYYVYLSDKTRQESLPILRVVGYLLISGITILLVLFAMNLHLPSTLWEGTFRDILLVLGLVIQIHFSQSFIYRNVFSKSADLRAVSPYTLGIFLLAVLVITTVIWEASTRFYYHSLDPIITFSVIVVICSIVIAYGRRVLNWEKTVLQTQVSAKSAELASLRAQINPHFLFNALNSLYATALKENSEKTADGIQKLGDMMRFMLQENNRDRIPLNKEVEYLHNYIDIQRMRVDETHPIEIRVNIQQPNREIYLAPMLLTSFVENAFKHGISLRNPSWIFITLTLDATTLYFKVHNSRHPRPAESTDQYDPEKDQSGVGLDNVRKRLELIYPGRHTLGIQQSEQDYFVSLTLVYW